MIQLTYDRVVQWVNEFPNNDDILGTPGNPCFCPIAEFIKAQGGYGPFVQCTSAYYFDSGDDQYTNPREIWERFGQSSDLEQFIVRLDAKYSFYEHDFVTKSMALDIINEIQEYHAAHA